MKRETLTGLLRPLVERMHTGHCWRKTADGPRRIDEVLTEIHLSEHVMGGAAYGLCPIAPGTATCRTACLDFDSHKGDTPWADMLATAANASLSLEMDGYAPHLFRSSGGKGIHIYLVWSDPQDAYSVREMLRRVLASCGLKPGTGGVVKSEVEIFPKQDEVPADGYGSMFVLPWSARSEPLEPFSGWRDSAPVPLHDRPAPSPVASTDAPDLVRLKSALDAIPNTGDKELSYDDWRNIIFGIHHATDGDDRGLALAHEFSARSSRHDAEFLDGRVWPYVRGERGGAVVTEGTVYATAAAHGWHDPTLVDDFEILLPSQAADAATSGIDSTDTTPDEGISYNFVPEVVFREGKPPAYILHNVIPDADLVVVYGESGSGKTFFVLDMVQSIARGEPWRGLTAKRGRVAYIVAEGSGGFRKRLKAYQQHNNVEATDLFVLADAPNFMAVPHVKAVIKAIKRLGAVSVVVVDTLAQVTPGANENAGEDMGKVINHCKQIKKHTGATVILIHHSGKDASKGARGWSGLRGAMDAEIEIVRAEHDRVATITKMKDGEEGTEFGFKLGSINVGTDEAGDTITSCVVEHGDAVAKRGRRALPLGEVERPVMDIVMDLYGLDGGAITIDDVCTEYVRRTPHDPQAKRDLRRQGALKAIKSLADRGKFSVDGAIIVLPVTGE